MITRTRKDSSNPYVMVSKGYLNDRGLSSKAKGILTFCLSKPDHWEFSLENLAYDLNEGIDSTRSGLEELIKSKYCLRVQSRKYKGRFGKVTYAIFESPYETNTVSATRKKKISLEKTPPLGQNPARVEGSPVIYKKVKNEKQKEDAVAPLILKKEEKKEVAPGVRLYPNEQKIFEEKCGGSKETMKACYLKLAEWKIKKGINTHRDDLKNLCNWVLDAIKNDKPSKNNKQVDETLKFREQENERERETIHRHWFDKITMGGIVLDKMYCNMERVEFKNEGSKSTLLFFRDSAFISKANMELTKRNLRK